MPVLSRRASAGLLNAGILDLRCLRIEGRGAHREQVGEFDNNLGKLGPIRLQDDRFLLLETTGALGFPKVFFA